jgi:transcriptional regulator with XRE-family HTH domain
MSSVRQKLGRVIRRLRTDRKYSQESFADAVGVHRTYVGAVERGETNISLDNLARIAKTLRVRLSEIFRLVEAED